MFETTCWFNHLFNRSIRCDYNSKIKIIESSSSKLHCCFVLYFVFGCMLVREIKLQTEVCTTIPRALCFIAQHDKPVSVWFIIVLLVILALVLLKHIKLVFISLTAWMIDWKTFHVNLNVQNINKTTLFIVVSYYTSVGYKQSSQLTQACIVKYKAL